MQSVAKNVVLLSTHLISNETIKKYHRLRAELDEEYDVVLLYNKEEDISCVNTPDDISVYTTDSDNINALGYNPIEDQLLPGSCHFPVLRFYLDHHMYKHYWFVEYDVEFTGDWSLLMNSASSDLSNYDFLSCHIDRYDIVRNGSWTWWYRNNQTGYPLHQCIKAFNPICRYSNAALECLNVYQKQGFSAHSEVMIPTCLYHHGMQIGDLGGQGEFVPHTYKNKFYRADTAVINGGTMRYRPLYTKAEITSLSLPNTLYHPLKE